MIIASNQGRLSDDTPITSDCDKKVSEEHCVSVTTTYPSPLIPLARRSGLEAVAAAYDAGLSVPVLAAVTREELFAQIERLIPKAETGAQWAEICRLEAEALNLPAAPTSECTQ